MKKRNFITGFSAAFVALITLASCGGIRSKDGVYITVNGKEYYAKDLYNDQKTPAAAEAKFNAVYKVAVRRYFDNDQEGHTYMEEITRDTKLKISGAKEEAKNNASKNGTKYDVEWKKILTSNGVDDEAGLYDKFEYDLQKTKFEEKIYDRQYDNQTEGKSNYDVLREGGFLKNNKGEEIVTGSDEKKIPGYLDNKIPYHMKHILVKISGGKENDDTSCEITSAEAQKLCEVITQLANGASFETVASSTLNDDETARKNRGSLGIMSKDTEFVNDFKLGTYLFESFFTRLTNGDEQGTTKYDHKNAKTAIFGTDETDKALKAANNIVKLKDPSAINNDQADSPKLGRIPYEAITDLTRPTGDKCKLYQMDLTQGETASRFAGISDVKAKYYPRNIIFNKYFNKHNIMVITNSKKPVYDTDAQGDFSNTESSNYIIKDGLKKGVGEDKYYGINCGSSKPTVEGADEKSGFKAAAKIKNENNISGSYLGQTGVDGDGNPIKEEVLCDENGRMILVFRSGTGGSKSSNDSSSGYQGIHFVVIERSPFIGKEYDTYYEGSTRKTHDDNNPTTLKEYYTQYYPGEIDGHHPTYKDGAKDDKRTYVNYVIGEEQSKLKDRASTIKSELKKTDSNLNTFVFEYLMKKGEIKFNQSSEEAKALATTIDNWINKTKRNYTKATEKRKWDDTWETYYENLELRNINREYVEDEGEKIAPEILIPVFAGEKSLTYSGGGKYTLKEVFGKEGAYNE